MAKQIHSFSSAHRYIWMELECMVRWAGPKSKHGIVLSTCWVHHPTRNRIGLELIPRQQHRPLTRQAKKYRALLAESSPGFWSGCYSALNRSRVPNQKPFCSHIHYYAAIFHLHRILFVLDGLQSAVLSVPLSFLPFRSVFRRYLIIFFLVFLSRQTVFGYPFLPSETHGCKQVVGLASKRELRVHHTAYVQNILLAEDQFGSASGLCIYFICFSFVCVCVAYNTYSIILHSTGARSTKAGKQEHGAKKKE